jgi:hypothetical protein
LSCFRGDFLTRARRSSSDVENIRLFADGGANIR